MDLYDLYFDERHNKIRARLSCHCLICFKTPKTVSPNRWHSKSPIVHIPIPFLNLILIFSREVFLNSSKRKIFETIYHFPNDVNGEAYYKTIGKIEYTFEESIWTDFQRGNFFKQFVYYLPISLKSLCAYEIIGNKITFINCILLFSYICDKKYYDYLIDIIEKLDEHTPNSDLPKLKAECGRVTLSDFFKNWETITYICTDQNIIEKLSHSIRQ